MIKNQFYCVKCKDKVILDENRIHPRTLSNGRSALTGECTRCGTKVFKFIKSSGGAKKKSKRKSAKRKSAKRKSKKRSKKM